MTLDEAETLLREHYKATHGREMPRRTDKELMAAMEAIGGHYPGYPYWDLMRALGELFCSLKKVQFADDNLAALIGRPALAR